MGQVGKLLFAIHGIVDSLHLKEIAQETHRSLEGLALGKSSHGPSSQSSQNPRSYSVPLSSPVIGPATAVCITL